VVQQSANVSFSPPTHPYRTSEVPREVIDDNVLEVDVGTIKVDIYSVDGTSDTFKVTGRSNCLMDNQPQIFDDGSINATKYNKKHFATKIHSYTQHATATLKLLISTTIDNGFIAFDDLIIPWHQVKRIVYEELPNEPVFIRFRCAKEREENNVKTTSGGGPR